MIIDIHTHAFPQSIRTERARFFAGEPDFQLLYESPKALLVGGRDAEVGRKKTGRPPKAQPDEIEDVEVARDAADPRRMGASALVVAFDVVASELVELEVVELEVVEAPGPASLPLSANATAVPPTIAAPIPNVTAPAPSQA